MQHPNKLLKDYKKLHRFYENGAVFTAFDTETTDISPTNGRIMEIGAVKFSKDDGIIGTWHHLFNPECEIPPFISQLTHITQDMVENEPLIAQELPSFLEFIGDSILIAHNAQFDLNFLVSECEKAGLEVPANKAIDTLQYSRFTYPTFERHKLGFLAEALSIDPGNAHRADDDARVCMELFKNLVLKNLNHIV